MVCCVIKPVKWHLTKALANVTCLHYRACTSLACTKGAIMGSHLSEHVGTKECSNNWNVWISEVCIQSTFHLWISLHGVWDEWRFEIQISDFYHSFWLFKTDTHLTQHSQESTQQSQDPFYVPHERWVARVNVPHERWVARVKRNEQGEEGRREVDEITQLRDRMLLQ